MTFPLEPSSDGSNATSFVYPLVVKNPEGTPAESPRGDLECLSLPAEAKEKQVHLFPFADPKETSSAD